MNETKFAAIAEKEFQRNGIKYQKEPPVHGGYLDYMIELNGKKHGVEVKINQSKTLSAIGQLINAKRVFSNIILLAPKKFIKKFEKFTSKSKDLSDLGLMTIEDGQLKTIKEPNPQEYYFNPPPNKEKKYKKKAEITYVTDWDTEVLDKFQNDIIMTFELAKRMNIRYANAQAKLRRLRRMGVIEAVNNTNPKTYKIIRKVNLGERLRYID